jgi:hypothetical protein
MRQQKIDLGSGLVALGALLLLVSLFLEWFAPSLAAFDVFEVVDWLLFALAVAILVGAGVTLGGSTRMPSWLPIAVIAAVFLVGAQLIDPPPAARGAEREIGAWLALAGAALSGLGLGLALANISVTVDVRGRERRRRVAAVDRRDAAADATPEPAPRPVAPTPPAAPDPQRTQPLTPLEPRPPAGGAETTEP